MNQLLSPLETEELLLSNYVGRLGCCKDNVPYVVPITYCYDKEDTSIIGFTGIGKKLHILRKNPFVCFEVDAIDNLSVWKTVIANGEYIEMKGIEAKKAMVLFVDRIRALSNKKDQLHYVKFLNQISHSDVHFSGSVFFRIKLFDKTGRFDV